MHNLYVQPLAVLRRIFLSRVQVSCDPTEAQATALGGHSVGRFSSAEGRFAIGERADVGSFAEGKCGASLTAQLHCTHIGERRPGAAAYKTLALSNEKVGPTST